MRHKPACDHDCFHCPFEDCLVDTLTTEERQEITSRERQARRVRRGLDGELVERMDKALREAEAKRPKPRPKSPPREKEVGLEEVAKRAMQEYFREYREANKERLKAYDKAYYEARKKRRRKCYQKNLEARRAYQREYYKKHREERLAYQDRYQGMNRDRILQRRRERRAKEQDVEGS